MKFNWITYNSEYKAIVDFWLDDDTRRFTAIDDSFELSPIPYFDFIVLREEINILLIAPQSFCNVL